MRALPDRYSAPWGLSVKLLTALALTVVGLVMLVVTQLPSEIGALRPVIMALLILSVAVSAVYTVRGYTITGRTLHIHRLLWSTELSLSGLVSVEHDPTAMARSLRVFGNGGLFGVTGWFWNRTLRRYRAYVSDPKLAVVLRFDERVVIVSPDAPRQFVAQLRDACGLHA